MIFVTVGTNEARFDRLLAAVAALVLEEELVVQHGASDIRPDHARCEAYMPFDVLMEHVRLARLVVTHAGVGSVIVALSNGKRPVVVPRRKQFGEAVDDHQVSFARRFAAAGLVTLVESPDQLGHALAAEPAGEAQLSANTSGLAEDVRLFIDDAVQRRR